MEGISSSWMKFESGSFFAPEHQCLIFPVKSLRSYSLLPFSPQWSNIHREKDTNKDKNYIWAILGTYSMFNGFSWDWHFAFCKMMFKRHHLHQLKLRGPSRLLSPTPIAAAVGGNMYSTSATRSSCSTETEWKLAEALGKEAALGDNTVVINITINRDQQGFFSPHALTTLLLTGSSNLEKFSSWFSISIFFQLPFLLLLPLILSDFNVLLFKCAEPKPSPLNDFPDPAVLHTNTDTYLLGLLLSMLIWLPSHICK